MRIVIYLNTSLSEYNSPAARDTFFPVKVSPYCLDLMALMPQAHCQLHTFNIFVFIHFFSGCNSGPVGWLTFVAILQLSIQHPFVGLAMPALSMQTVMFDTTQTTSIDKTTAPTGKEFNVKMTIVRDYS